MIATIMSWVGAVLVLAAFGLNISDKIKADSKAYATLNLLGSSLLAASAFITTSYAFVVLNTVWALFALYSILRKKG